MFSLLNQQVRLEPGKYIFMIDPVWNSSAEANPLYKEVLVDIYAPEAVEMTQVNDELGMQVLCRALKGAAMELSPVESRETYLEEDEDYGKDVIRVSDVESLDCWYGYIYTYNNSPYRLQETLRLTLQGLEVIYPPQTPGEEEIDIDIPAGQDNIVVLRRTQNRCQYGLQYLTHPRELEDDEMIEIAKQMEANQYGEALVYYKLYNTAKAAVFFFENREKDKAFQCLMEMEMENL